jgi:hypothetical protein
MCIASVIRLPVIQVQQPMVPANLDCGLSISDRQLQLQDSRRLESTKRRFQAISRLAIQQDGLQ